MSTARDPTSGSLAAFATWCSLVARRPSRVELVDDVVYVTGGPTARELAPHVPVIVEADGVRFNVRDFGALPRVPVVDLLALLVAVSALACVAAWGMQVAIPASCFAALPWAVRYYSSAPAPPTTKAKKTAE